MKSKPLSFKSKMGALVRYCGHEGTFVADIIPVAEAAVVRANGPITMGNLNRNKSDYEAATHHLSDFPCGGFWRPDLGVFVVPQAQVRELPR